MLSRTDPVERVATRGPGDPAQAPRRVAPLPVAAAVAALWAAVVGLAPLVALSALAAMGTGAATSASARIGMGAWLLGHGVPVATPSDRITLVPLAVTVLAVWRLARAGVHAGRAAGAHRSPSVRPAVAAGLLVAVAYAGIGAAAAVFARSSDLEISPARAAAMFGSLAAVAAVLGALGHGRSGRRLLRRAPRVLVDAVRAAVAAVALLLASGAAASGIALASSGGEATQMLGAFGAGITGQLGITALCLIYIPNLAVWGAAYLVGPGFAVGVGTVVSPGDVLVGPLPPLPVFSALPTGELTGVGPVLLGVPFVAGLVAGALLARRPLDTARLVGSAGLSGPVAGVLVYLAMVASRGGLGSGRLAALGPTDSRVAFLAGGVIAAGAVIGALSRRSLSRTGR
jgi:hypothetical protein